MRMAPLPDAVRKRCINERLHVEGVNEAVWTTIREFLLDSDEVARELGAWAEQSAATPPETDARMQRAAMRLNELARQRDRLTDAYQLGALPLDVFRDRIFTIDEARLAAEQQLSNLKAEHLEAEVTRSRALGAQDIARLLRPSLLTADFEAQQTILRLLVERVIVTNQCLEIHLALPVSGNFRLTSGHRGARQHAHGGD